MTLNEYERAITQLEVKKIELEEQCKRATMSPPKTYFTELEIAVIKLLPTKKEELIKCFNYADERDRTRAILPKSIFTSYDILNTTTRQTPQELRSQLHSSARGYEIALAHLGNILNLETSLEFNKVQIR